MNLLLNKCSIVFTQQDSVIWESEVIKKASPKQAGRGFTIFLNSLAQFHRTHLSP